MAKGIPDGKRYLHIYTRSQEQKKKFEQLAEDNKTSTSKFYLNIIEEWEQNGGRRKPDIAVSEDLNTMREENLQLRERTRTLTRDNDRLSQELQKLRNEAFLRPAGDVALDPDLLQVLQDAPIHSHKLLDALGIDQGDAEAVRVITRQLEDLERTGFIARGARGWRWLK